VNQCDAEKLLARIDIIINDSDRCMWLAACIL